MAILQYLLCYDKLLTQDEWASVAKTTSKGTSIAGIKRGILLMAKGFDIVRKTNTIFKNNAIVYDHARDHWMVAQPCKDMVVLYDPEFGTAVGWNWKEFQAKYMNSKKNSYALVVDE